MHQPSRLLGRAFFGAAVLAALGFGGTQAFAEPARDAARAYCDHGRCNEMCVGQGYAGGSCVTQWKCMCY